MINIDPTHGTGLDKSFAPSNARQLGRKKHCRSTKRLSAKSTPPPSPPERLSGDGGGFLTLLLNRIEWTHLNGLQQRKHAAGRKAHALSRGRLLAAILFHYTVTYAGTLGEHLFWLLGIQMSESNLSERRQALPFVVFEELLKRVLRPLSQVSTEAFYRGLRLVAIDGVSFSLPNTAQVNQRCKKARNCTGGRNPFAKLQAAALIELVMHNPLAARLGWKGESEWRLAHGLLDHLPPQCLLLADRLYGCGAFVLAAWARLQACGGHFLVRVKLGMKIVRVVRPLADGSRLVEVRALDPQNHHRVAGTMQVREIQVKIQRPGYRSVQLRLWTSLLDPQLCSACELAALYAARWEQELYFRELKSELKLNNLLHSHTPETAAQEVAAMIIGSSLIAEARSKLQPGEELSHRISFIKVWETLEPLWLTLLLGADILSEKQKQQLSDRFHALASRRCMPKKRSRACPRALRQPHQPWPRKKNQKSSTAPLQISVMSLS
jgi:hypothetical protein